MRNVRGRIKDLRWSRSALPLSFSPSPRSRLTDTPTTMETNTISQPRYPLTVQWTIPTLPHPLETTIIQTPLAPDGRTRLVDKQATNRLTVSLQRHELRLSAALEAPSTPPPPPPRSRIWRSCRLNTRSNGRSLRHLQMQHLICPMSRSFTRIRGPLNGRKYLRVSFMVPLRFVDATRESARRLPGFLSFSGIPTGAAPFKRAMQSMTLSWRDGVSQDEA